MRDMTQEGAHRMGLLARFSPGAYDSRLATNEFVSQELGEHSLPSRLLHLSAAYASNLPTPATVKEADAASKCFEIWWNPRVCELGGLLQAHTFEPA